MPPRLHSLFSVVGVLVCAAAARAQPIDDAARAKIAAREWPGVIAVLKPGANEKPTGDRAYWLALAYAHTGNEKGATALLAELHKASPLDRSITLAVLRYADPWWLRERVSTDFPLVQVDEEVAAAYVRGCARIVEKWQAQNIERAARMADSDTWAVANAFDQYELVASKVDPELAWIGGYAHRKTFGPHKAVALLEYAAARLPQSWDLELDLALAYLGVGHLEKGKAHYETARTMAPAQAQDDRGGLSRKGACLLAWSQGLHGAGRYKEAVTAFREFLAAHPTFGGARHYLGRAAYHAGDLPLAMWALNDSIDLESNMESYYYLGRCWFDTEEYGVAKALLVKARDAYKAAEVTRPEDLTFYLGRAEWNLGQREEALKNLDLAFVSRPDSVERARVLFQAYIAMEDPYGAIETCRRFGSQTSIADNKVREEGIEEVLRRWPQELNTPAAKAKPMSHMTLAKYTRAQVAFRNFRFREAVEQLRAVMTRRPVIATGNSAWALLLSGYPEDAESVARYAAATQKPEAAADEARLCQGVSLICLKKWSEATAVLQAIKTKAIFDRRDVALLYASIGAGKPDASLMNGYNVLGVIETASDTLSVQILMILPGSPLLKCDPPLKAGDYVDIAGSSADTWVQYARDMKKLPAPTGVVGIHVDRKASATADFTGFGMAAAPEKKP